MRINVGDLVHIKTCSYLNHKHNDEIWLVVNRREKRDKLGNSGLIVAWLQLQNVHNRNKVTYREAMLMKIETEASC